MPLLSTIALAVPLAVAARPDALTEVPAAPATARSGALITLPAAPEHDGLAPDGWFLRVEFDVPAPGSDFTLTLTPGAPDGGAPTTLEIPRESLTSIRGSDLLRASARVTDLGPAAGSGDLRVHLGGRRAGDAARVTVTRHHTSPTRKLIGKANGHLGPDQLDCGMLGFVALTEHQHTALSILDVRADSPAAAAGLRPGDLITAVQGEALPPSSIAPGWEWFRESHEAVLGRAIEAALGTEANAITLTVESEVDDAITVRDIALRLPIEGPVDPGFPFTGDLGERLHADLVRWTVEHQRPNGSWPGTDAVNPSLGALALLGTGDEEHSDRIARAVEYLLRKAPKASDMRGLAYWQISFQGILFAELQLASDAPDERLLPWIEDAVTWLPTTTHESKWGTQAFGHGPDGLPYDDKALMAPTAHLLVLDALARRCGLESRIWEHVEPYVRHSWSDPTDGGHGAMGYNGSYRDKGEFWSRTGLVALAEVLRGGDVEMTPHLCVLMEERHPWMLNSHAYGEPGAALGLLSLAVVKPEAFAAILPQYRWRFLCAWEPGHGLRYTTPHMGAPYMGGESIVNLSYLTLFAAREKGLAIAGRGVER